MDDRYGIGQNTVYRRLGNLNIVVSPSYENKTHENLTHNVNVYRKGSAPTKIILHENLPNFTIYGMFVCALLDPV